MRAHMSYTHACTHLLYTCLHTSLIRMPTHISHARAHAAQVPAELHDDDNIRGQALRGRVRFFLKKYLGACRRRTRRTRMPI